jgi:hypothetical protein
VTVPHNHKLLGTPNFPLLSIIRAHGDPQNDGSYVSGEIRCLGKLLNLPRESHIGTIIDALKSLALAATQKF